MNHRPLSVLLLLVALGGVQASGDDTMLRRVDAALARAGDNAGQLRQALAGVPPEQQAGMQFLVAYMPPRDLETLSAAYLLKNVRLAYRARQEAPWKDRVSEDLFFNEVLPYACVNERRDDWRADFYQRFQPLVADTNSPGEAAVILNQKIFDLLQVKFSRGRPKADQSPLESVAAGMASCTGLSVLLVDACRAVGAPARFAGTPLWTNKSGNHSWVEIWDGDWHYTGAAEPSGGQLDRAWFTGRAATARGDHPLHAIYATSYRPTGVTFPLVWDRTADYVHAVNVTHRYTKPAEDDSNEPLASETAARGDVEASLHAVAQLKKYLQATSAERPPLAEQDFADVPLSREHAEAAKRLLWNDHVARIKRTRAAEMQARRLTAGDLQMPFFYTVSGEKPKNGRSLYISLHGGGGAPPQVNDQQWENQKRLYRVEEGVYLAPRAPTNCWNLWHQGHIDGLFDRLIENLIVFEDVNPNRVYLLGYSAGGDGVYQLAPRMADRLAAAAMMAGHPNEASPRGLRNVAFTIHVGGNDSAYKRNEVARRWGEQLDALQKEDPAGYVHRTKIYEGKSHWLDREDAAALPWMARHTRNPLPERIVWRQDDVTHARFYWLAVPPDEQRNGTEIRARRKGQQIDLQADGVRRLVIRLNDRMLNLDQAVTVTSQQKTVFQGRVSRSIGMLARTLAERGDPELIFSGEINVTLPEERS